MGQNSRRPGSALVHPADRLDLSLTGGSHQRGGDRNPPKITIGKALSYTKERRSDP